MRVRTLPAPASQKKLGQLEGSSAAAQLGQRLNSPCPPPTGKFTDQYKATIGVDFIYQKYRILKQDFTLHMYACTQ